VLPLSVFSVDDDDDGTGGGGGGGGVPVGGSLMVDVVVVFRNVWSTHLVAEPSKVVGFRSAPTRTRSALPLASQTRVAYSDYALPMPGCLPKDLP
jgi:hypothetical protein